MMYHQLYPLEYSNLRKHERNSVTAGSASPITTDLSYERGSCPARDFQGSIASGDGAENRQAVW